MMIIQFLKNFFSFFFSPPQSDQPDEFQQLEFRRSHKHGHDEDYRKGA